jgi:hypothetical protein
VFPDHYALPEGLDHRLIGYVRRDYDDIGHYITTLWRDEAGQYFFYEDYWTPYSPPFWWGVTPDQLTPCDDDTFCDHIETVMATVSDTDEQNSLWFRYAELLTVWGVLEGVEKGFAWARENPDKY